MSRRRRKAAVCCSKAAGAIRAVENLTESGLLKGPVLDELAKQADEFADKFAATAVEANQGADDD